MFRYGATTVEFLNNSNAYCYPGCMDKELTNLRLVAAQAAAAGMAIIKEWRESGRDIQAHHTGKGPGDDYVTAVDYAAEEAVMQVLKKWSPTISVFGEMSGGEIGTSPLWVIDSMDGTTNFVSGGTFVSVTLALLREGQPVVGATGCPFTGELWSAAKGLGIYDASGKNLLAQTRPESNDHIAFDPVISGPATLAVWNEAVQRLTNAFKKVEPLTSIALEMAYVAAGKFDGWVSIGGPDPSTIQDFAAGNILIREAGGIVTGIDGNLNPWESPIVIAGTPQTYEKLRQVLKGLL
jgi:myo-inositol-1(or 4)-monophosphatase